jgi:hypothetical protein
LLAEHDGRLYLDLAEWRAVESGPEGWRVIPSPPVRFRRAAGMLSLPVPVKGGLIDAAAPFINLSDRSEFVLVVAWLVAALVSGCSSPLAFGMQRSNGARRCRAALHPLTTTTGIASNRRTSGQASPLTRALQSWHTQKPRLKLVILIFTCRARGHEW